MIKSADEDELGVYNVKIEVSKDKSDSRDLRILGASHLIMNIKFDTLPKPDPNRSEGFDSHTAKAFVKICNGFTIEIAMDVDAYDFRKRHVDHELRNIIHAECSKYALIYLVNQRKPSDEEQVMTDLFMEKLGLSFDRSSFLAKFSNNLLEE